MSFEYHSKRMQRTCSAMMQDLLKEDSELTSEHTALAMSAASMIVNAFVLFPDLDDHDFIGRLMSAQDILTMVCDDTAYAEALRLSNRIDDYLEYHVNK